MRITPLFCLLLSLLLVFTACQSDRFKLKGAWRIKNTQVTSDSLSTLAPSAAFLADVAALPTFDIEVSFMPDSRILFRLRDSTLFEGKAKVTGDTLSVFGLNEPAQLLYQYGMKWNLVTEVEIHPLDDNGRVSMVLIKR